MKYKMDIHFDKESNQWYSTSEDVPGFVAGANSLDLLLQESSLTIYDLLGEETFEVQFNMHHERAIHYG